jgi:methanogenic corrinoid protein MtbC1
VAQFRRDRRIVLATPAGELPVVALRMVANLLRGAGYDVVMLGGDVPAVALVGSRLPIFDVPVASVDLPR